MSKTLLQYRVADANWKLEIPEHVALFLSQHIQHAWNMKESVGQLYSRDLTTNTIVIDQATPLKPAWSRRARVQFLPSAAMAERKMMFSKGLHWASAVSTDTFDRYHPTIGGVTCNNEGRFQMNSSTRP